MENLRTEIEVKELPACEVAYVRHVGPYKGNDKLFEELFGKLMRWAGPRNLIQFPNTRMMTLYHDDPEITAEEKLRISVCMSVPKDTETDGDIGRMSVAGGQYAVGSFELDPHEYEDAWNLMMGGWLPESGYQPDDWLCYENYLGTPDQHPEGKHVVEICIPVKPL